MEALAISERDSTQNTCIEMQAAIGGGSLYQRIEATAAFGWTPK